MIEIEDRKVETDIDIYNKKRKRIIELYKLINGIPFPIITMQKYLMTINELKHREYFDFGTDYKEDPYDEYKVYYLRIPQIIPVLPNLENFNMMGIKDPINNIPKIYDSIQEYIHLWCYMMENHPYYNHPPINELKELETLALWAFRTYNYNCKYKTNIAKKDKKQKFDNGPKSAESFLRLLSGNKYYQETKFISYIDNYLNKFNKSDINHTPNIHKEDKVITMFGDWT